jgi:hypothetical protein
MKNQAFHNILFQVENFWSFSHLAKSFDEQEQIKSDKRFFKIAD